MGSGNLRWVVIVVGVIGLLAARSWLREQFANVIKVATTPDENPIWAESPDWSERTIDFDPDQLVPALTYPQTDP